MQNVIRKALAAIVSDPAVDKPLRLRSRVGDTAPEDDIGAAWPDLPALSATRALWRTTGSAELYQDIDYGQWGLRLLDPLASRKRTDIERSGRPSDFEEGDIVLGEFLGDLELLVVDAMGSVRVALPIDPRSEWYVAAADLAEFLTRYREAHGAKFWEASSHVTFTDAE
jgi:hypothetical protein